MRAVSRPYLLGRLFVLVAVLPAMAFSQISSSVSLSSSGNPSTLGSRVMLTATVTSGATGKVTFYDGTTVLGTSTISSSEATFTTVLLPAGKRDLHAYYAGDSTYQSSKSAVVTQTVVAQPSLGLKAPVSYSVSFYPQSAVTGDFNGDGKPDLFTTTNGSGPGSILLGNGDGTFQAAVPVSGAYGYYAVVGDFNGDGKQDLALIDGQYVLICIGKGDGTFAAAVEYSMGIYGWYISAGDFNGDGVIDLAVSSSSGIGILLGKSDGTFQTPAVLYSAPSPGRIVVADFNGDSVPDIAVAGSGSSSFYVFIGNGDGTFQAAISHTTPGVASKLAAADFNGDGYVDLVVTDYSYASVYVLLGNGDGTFQSPVSYASTPSANSLSVGDVNGDGNLDIIVASSYTSGLIVILGNGDGTFQSPTPVLVSYSYFAAVGDFNGDGKTDLAVNFSSIGDSIGVLLGGAIPDLSISVAHGVGFSQGQTGARYTIAVKNVGDIATTGAVAVVNTAPSGFTPTSISGSGWTCILASLACTRSDSLSNGASYGTITIIGNISGSASGSITDTATVSGGGDQNLSNNAASDTVSIRYSVSVSLASNPNPSTLGQPISLVATLSAPATGTVTFYDGLNPIGVATISAGQATLTTALLSSGPQILVAGYDGDSNYGPAQSSIHIQTVNAVTDNGVSTSSSYKTDNNPQYVAVGDFNLDGKLDLVTTNGGSAGHTSVSVLLGKGDGTFQTAVTYPTTSSAFSYTIAVADVNLDGKPDLVLSLGQILLGNGDGTFQSAITFNQTTFSGVVVTDVNRDGIPDLLGVNPGTNIEVFFGKGDGTFQAPVTTAATEIYGNNSWTVTDLNGDGIPDLVDANQSSPYGVIAWLGNTDGTFQAPKSSAGSSLANPLEGFVVGDFNGDGKPDVGIVYWVGVSFMPGNGDGTFQSPTQSRLSLVPGSPAQAGDYNGDGKLDIAYRGYSQGTVTIVLGNGDGTFQLGATFNTDGISGNMIAGDFNRDGKPDLAVVNSNTSTVNIFLGGQYSSLSVASSHTGYLVAGQTGSYTLSASNPTFTATSGTVTVTDSLPAGLTATAISGEYPWTCALATVSCSMSNGAAAGSNLSPITVTVSVAANVSPGILTNRVSIVSNLGTGTANDPTSIVSPSTISLTVNGGRQILGLPVTLTATVGSGETGTVLFLDGANPLGVAAISGSQATLTTSLLPAGRHQLRATYTGDATHSTVNSAISFLKTSSLPTSGTTTPLTNSTGTGDAAIAMGDFNNDGQADVVTANSTANTVSVLIGKGDGTFQAHVDYAVGAKPVSVTIGDFNGDGKQDLAVANQTGNSISILLGNGDGTFQAASNAVGVSSPSDVAVGDFNGDGREDLVVVSATSGSTTIFLGNGDGTLQSAKNTFNNSDPVMMVGDFNNDNKADLIVGGPWLYVLLGNGDGTFNQSYYSYTGGSAIAVGDVNGDGFLDVISNTNVSTASIAVALGLGSGSFQTPQNYSSGITPSSLILADVNGDGTLDIVASTNSSTSIYVLFGNGDGTFQSPISYSLGATPAAIVAGDVNGDGRTDLLFPASNNSVNILLGVLTPVLSVTSQHAANFYQNESGAAYTVTVSNLGPGLTDLTTITVTDTLPSGLTATSISGTAWVCDLPSLTCTRVGTLAPGNSFQPITISVNVASNAGPSLTNIVNVSGGGSIAASGMDPTTVGVLPPPVLTLPTNTATLSSLSTTLTWAASAGATSYDVYFGTSTPPPLVTSTTSLSYATPPLSPGVTYYWYVAADSSSGTGVSAIWSFRTPTLAGDFSGSGHPDLLWQDNSTGQVALWYMGGGQGATYESWAWLAPGNMSGWSLVGAVDFNGDKHPDLLWQNKTTGQAAVWYMGGAQGNTYQSWTWINNGISPGAGWTLIGAADFNGDGHPDLMWQNNSTRQIAVWYMGGAQGATYESWNWLANGATPGTGWTLVTAADFNGDGLPDLVWQNNATLQVAVWYMGGSQGAAYQSWSWLANGGTPGNGWSLVGTVDVNGDGSPDLFWQDDTTGQVAVWFMGGPQGATYESWTWAAGGASPGSGWSANAKFN